MRTVQDGGLSFRRIEELLLSKHAVIKKNKLDFLHPILAGLGNPQDRLGRVAHITGTNGKGSTACLLESVLRSAGYRTALYTSPHVRSLRERMKYCGREITESEFAAVFREVYPLCAGLTFFEIMTVMALRWFAEKKPDFSVIEVGIGGKFDTTNVIRRKELCFITSLGYDHKELLGGTLEEIAGQKAGIIAEGSVCVCPDYPPRLKKIIRASAAAAGGRAVFVRNFFRIDGIDPAGGGMTVTDIPAGVKYRTGLAGARQAVNLSLLRTGLAVLEERGLALRPGAFAEGLAAARLEGRFQIVTAGAPGGRAKTFIVDGAHNGEALRNLLETLELAGVRDAVFVFGVLNSKDYLECLGVLSGRAQTIIFTRMPSEKAVDPRVLACEYRKLNPAADIRTARDAGEALAAAAALSGRVCVCGSFYLAAEALRLLGRGAEAA
jgi:dihydrofolate synthase/folylpolyglutamate synthase